MAQLESLSKKIPGPNKMPLLGWRGRLLQFAHHPIFFMERLHQEYGEIVAAERGNQNFIFTFSSEYNQQILNSPHQFYSYDFTNMPLHFPQNSELMKMNTGLSLINGLQHKRIRRLMLPFFQRKHILAHHTQMVMLTEKMLAKWKTGQDLNLLKEMEDIALWLSVKALFGLDQDQQGSVLVQKLEDVMSKLYSLPTLVLPFNLRGLPFWHLVQKANEVAVEIQALINVKRAHGNYADDVLSNLLLAHDEDNLKLSDEELIGQAITLFRGSYPTSAAAMTWTILLLLQHPNILASLLDELSVVLGGAVPTADQLTQLTLLDAVINESMRLLPPTPWVVRYNIEPVQLGPYVFAEKTNFVIGIYITHRLPEFYSKPRCFLPTRWQATITPSPYEYLPFISGPRMCIGATFAKTLMKIVLAMVLQKYSFSLPLGTKVDVAGIRGLIPAHGLSVLLNEPGRIPVKTELFGNINTVVDW